MNWTAILGAAATFLAGASVALFATYPVKQNTLFVCFIAIAVLALSLGLAVVATILHVAHRSWRKALPMVEYAVERQLDERGLHVVKTE